ncbi:MAG: hypothetical protein DHS20C18_26310 [Saprospiraceae bacterium]|nr:MAG: hypothetical protein DHS20C18_26310 [Saprospiraceae bacterium]
MISKGLKNPLTKEDIFSDEIKLSHLKRIDKIFEKGLHYYLDPKSPNISKDASIFFRKQSFETDLNIGAKKVVNQFEEFKISLSAISKLANLDFDRSIDIYSVQDNPKEIAKNLRKTLYPSFDPNLRFFLKLFISKLAENNILVFEFVETWNKLEKANIDGVFLSPNVIVLKRQQRSFRREIFTLAHELGHYLLNKEEVEKLDYSVIANQNLSAIEKWCNDFSFHFLAGEYAEILSKLEIANSANDYHFDIVEEISKHTHLSQIAIFTKLLFDKKISPFNYNKVKEDFDNRYREILEEEKKLKELNKINGIKPGGSTPKPIKSPLLISTIQTAFYEGVLNEYEVCKRLNISPDKLDKYI